MLAVSAAAELPAELRTLNLIELVNLVPGGVADGSGYVNLELQNGHGTCGGLAVRKPLVQHEIYDDAGDRNVHPQRPSPAGDCTMLIVASTQATI